MTYQYAHTTTEVIKQGLNKQILRPYVRKYLYSLYNGFNNSNFGYNSLHKLSYNIKEFYDNLYPNEELIIDSGGYSAIVGDINPRDISKFIECYCYFLEYHNEHLDYIMSLDIPIMLEYPKYNTYDTIRNFNFKSYGESKKILNKNEELYKKFIFVWHFKLHKQFKIWREIYDVFFEENKVNHHAIGGLVSLRGVTGIKFSPFIGPAYRCLKLIENNEYKNSLIHILGVYGRHDRLFMQIMNQLFNEHYLKDKNKTIDITFDTINYTISGLYRIRDLPLIQLLKSKSLLQSESKTHEYLEKFIPNKQVLEKILKEIQNIKNNKQIEDTRILSLTYVIYSAIIDKMMQQFIQEENIIELFIKNPDYNKLKNKLLPIIYRATKKYPFAFANLDKQILSNFYWLINFHRAYIDGAELDRIDKGIEHFIDAIKFPFDLK